MSNRYTENHRRDIIVSYPELRVVLFRKGMTLSYLAQRGFSHNTVHDIREGRPISRYTLDKLIKLIGCDEKEILQ